MKPFLPIISIVWVKVSLYVGVAKMQEGRDLTWSWLESNWDAYAKQFNFITMLTTIYVVRELLELQEI